MDANIAITDALAAPFDPRDVKFKPQMVKNNRALAMPYIDARLVQDRLDQVVGVEGWQDRYSFLPDGSVVCQLKVKIGQKWITKTDVGAPSEQPDAGDRVKAAVSDALKRTAVKFGIGRYLYRLQAQWVDYDPVKKQLSQIPQLPSWAVPEVNLTGRAKPAAQKPAQPQQPAKAAPAQNPKDGPLDEGMVREWKQWLTTKPTLDELNLSKEKLREMNTATLTAVFNLFVKYGDEAGFGYDNHTKKFVSLLPQGVR